MLLVKKLDFFHLFIYGKIRKEKSLWRYSRKKKHLSGIESRRKQNRKIGLFPKRLVHGFSQKMGFFPPLQFRQNRQKKVLGDILERINAFLDCKNKKQKNAFIKGVIPWFWSKNGIFSTFSFLAKEARKKVFGDILQRKNTFL